MRPEAVVSRRARMQSAATRLCTKRGFVQYRRRSFSYNFMFKQPAESYQAKFRSPSTAEAEPAVVGGVYRARRELDERFSDGRIMCFLALGTPYSMHACIAEIFSANLSLRTSNPFFTLTPERSKDNVQRSRYESPYSRTLAPPDERGFFSFVVAVGGSS